VQDQSLNPSVSNIDQENQAMNHSDLKAIEFAAFGADRGHYSSAQEMQCFSGIAPVIKRSEGVRKFV
jgi:hypothetical protein